MVAKGCAIVPFPASSLPPMPPSTPSLAPPSTPPTPPTPEGGATKTPYASLMMQAAPFGVSVGSHVNVSASWPDEPSSDASGDANDEESGEADEASDVSSLGLLDGPRAKMRPPSSAVSSPVVVVPDPVPPLAAFREEPLHWQSAAAKRARKAGLRRARSGPVPERYAKSMRGLFLHLTIGERRRWLLRIDRPASELAHREGLYASGQPRLAGGTHRGLQIGPADSKWRSRDSLAKR